MLVNSYCGWGLRGYERPFKPCTPNMRRKTTIVFAGFLFVRFIVFFCRATTFSSQCSNSTDYVNRVNVEFMKLGARGVTILAASGDAGAPGRANEHCDQVSYRSMGQGDR